MKKEEILFGFDDFEWEGINIIDYNKEGGSKVTFKNVTRQNLFEGKGTEKFDVRYFECGEDGHTTLEKHEHAHIVMVLRGKGKAVIEDIIIDVKALDFFVIPSWAKHQLINAGKEPFGFICTVNSVRDKAQLLTQREIDGLKQIPTIGQNMKITKDYMDG